MSIYVLAILFLIIAMLYASAGFGGGSSYIALLLISGYAIGSVRFTALICNLIVVAMASFFYLRSDLLKMREVWPLVIFSVPFAFMGGMVVSEAVTFKAVAAVSLILSSVLMLINIDALHIKDKSTRSLSMLSGGIGFLSGFIGIGGGIFLAPALHITKWQQPKTISAMCSLFILVNSAAGLLGQLTRNPQINLKDTLILALAVLLGGLAGNRLNIHILPSKRIKQISAVLIAMVGIRILLTI